MTSSRFPVAGPTQVVVLEWLDRFEEAWRGSRPPRIEDFLTAIPVSAAAGQPLERGRLLAELVKTDLEYRWRSAADTPFDPADFPNHPLLESYAERFPELRPVESLPLDLIAEEYRVRRRWGDRPQAEEYAARFAAQWDRLRPVLEEIDAELTGGETGSGANRLVRTSPETLPEVPGYEVLEELGRGGMGVVYKARQLDLDRLVALKMIRTGDLAGAEELCRFQDEARVLARLQHPHIVQVFETGVSQGRPYFSMEYVGGASLAQRLNGVPLSPREAARLMETLARAVQAAHEHRLVHRDLKPANVLLTEHGQPKITDFGLARALDRTGQTASGAIVGTPQYMPPEQAAGKGKAVGPAADVYALGAILYECLTGRPPFRGVTMMDTLAQVLADEPVPPRRLQPKTPPDLETICLKCLAKEPRRRYGNAADMAEDLRRFQAGEPILARPVSTWRKARQWARRRPVWATLVGVLLLAGIALVSVGLWYNGHLRLERDRVQAQRVHAEANFRKALAMVDELLQPWNKLRVTDQPEIDEARKTAFEQALKFFESFLPGKEETDPGMRHEAGLAYARRAGIRQVLLQEDQAADDFQQAIALETVLAREFPDVVEYRQELARCHFGLGFLNRQLGRYAEAEAAFLQSAALHERLALGRADAAEQQDLLANSYYELSALLQQQGEAVRANAWGTKAEAIWDELIRLQPDRPEYVMNRVRTRFNQGLSISASQPQRARELYLAALDSLTGLIKKFPHNLAYQKDLASIHEALGSLYPKGVDATSAEKHFRLALQIRQPLTFYSRTALPQARHNLAHFYLRCGRVQDAEREFAEAVRSYAALVEEQPLVLGYRERLASSLTMLAFTQEYSLPTPDSLRASLGCPGQPVLDRIRHLRWAAAEENYGKAHDLGEVLVHEHPGNTGFALTYAMTCNDLGNLKRKSNRPKEAREFFEKAVTASEDVLRRDPTNALAQERAMNAQGLLAVLLLEIEDFPAAVPHLDRLIELETRLSDRERYRWFRVASLANARRHDRALPEATSLHYSAVLNPGDWLNITDWMARAARLALGDANLSSGDRDTIADRYGTMAVEALRRAHAAHALRTPEQIAQVRTDPDLDVLRKRPDFQVFLKEVENAASAKAP